MNWLLAYAIGALVWLSLMLFAAQVADGDRARQNIAVTALWDAIIWPLAMLRFAGCLLEAARELIAEHRRNGGTK